MENVTLTPRQLGYRFPAEFEPHEAMWLSWPHNPDTWPGKIETIFPSYCAFIQEVSKSEEVRINVKDATMEQDARRMLLEAGVSAERIRYFHHPTNDAWCRDHGPAFVVNRDAPQPKAIIDWGYNAWGGKYPPYDLDDVIPTLIGDKLGLPVFYPGIVMEGGSVEFNGDGTLLTSTACLLNPNRNPLLNQGQIEAILSDYYGVEQILWVDEGIIGDDTDGHIDDTVRFVNRDTVVTVIETNVEDENHSLLQHNLKQLKAMRLRDGLPLNIIELPMPDPVYYQGQRLPVSYANFYIANHAIIVPVFHSSKDEIALRIIQDCFPERTVVGIDSRDIIWGLGSFHCLSQQEPLV
ncbi:MAG TPA: agmatine deiminase family protein [Saprospiraceae bacterium]|nr:agmatine deiminase family protein [Saprospiraceae bacterium]